eukprot:SAG31_NODE_414_length_15953_cov_2.982528_5_plen_81_part_00
MCDRLFLQTEFLQMREKVRCKFSYCSCLIVLILNTAVVGRLDMLECVWLNLNLVLIVCVSSVSASLSTVLNLVCITRMGF